MKKGILTLLLAVPMLTGCNWKFAVPGKNNAKVEYVEISEHRADILLGETKKLSATVFPEKAGNKNVSWSISNTNIATIDSSGTISTVATGLTQAVVTTEEGGFKDYCDVYVYREGMVTGLKISSNYLKMEVGDVKSLSATVTPSSATNKTVTWVSSDTSIATVSELGTITAVKEGTTNITCQTVEGGYKAVCSVKVGEKREMWDSSQDSLRNGSKTLDFYSFNDLHGATEESSDGAEPGIVRLASYIKAQKAKNEDGFVITSSGDMWQGSADSNITRGRLVIDWMNELGFAGMALGNHEFDWKIETIEANQQRCNFDMLACNIEETESGKIVDWVEPYTTITRNGVHIGIIGAIGEGITSSIVASNVKGLKFADPNPYILSWNQYLRENGADMVIVLTHDSIGSINYETGNAVDLIFGGHTHTCESSYIGSAPAIQASCNGKYVGHIGITYDFETQTSSEITHRYDATSVSNISSYGKDSVTEAIYQNYLDNEISEVKDEVVSTYTSGISKGDIPYVYNAYAYKYFVDVHKAEDNYEITFVWNNAARADILPSSKGITYGDLYKALPFDNYLCLCQATGSQVKSMSKYGNYSYPDGSSANWNTIKNSLTNAKTYYFLVINFIVESKVNASNFEYVSSYMEEDAMPRNIVKRYISGYPSNCGY